MGGHSSEHVNSCPVHAYLTKEEEDIRESLDAIKGMFEENAILVIFALLWLFAVPASLGFAVGHYFGPGWGWATFIATQFAVFVIPKRGKK